MCGAVRFSIGLPSDQVEHAAEFVNGDAIAECAAAFEDMGFDACFVTDHPAPDAKWFEAGGHHALDPFVALSFAAAATTRLRLQTHILVLPYRNPLLTAKSVLSLDVCSGGRLTLGVGPGYLKPEFFALGADFEQRNEATDEAIDVIRGVLSNDVFAYDSPRFSSRGTTMQPPPAQRPAPPSAATGGFRSRILRALLAPCVPRILHRSRISPNASTDSATNAQPRDAPSRWMSAVLRSRPMRTRQRCAPRSIASRTRESHGVLSAPATRRAAAHSSTTPAGSPTCS